MGSGYESVSLNEQLSLLSLERLQRERHLTGACPWVYNSYVIDFASSHMFVLKIKPFIFKCKKSIRWNYK